jgi:5-methylcytosine-specific restriction endonuclease McrA
MPTIQDYINTRHKYKIDQTYQRPPGAWSPQDNQCLIDTILRKEPIPLFFINEKTGQGIYFVVDGQQRLLAIEQFYDNKLRLNKKFSGVENHGKTFNREDPISDEQRETFLNYTLNFYIIEDYDDERIRLIFSRLQRGRPLTLGERLNAMPGNIVLCMREIANHPFMSKSIGVSKDRYGAYPDAARILFYEKYGQRDAGTPSMLNFFDESQNLTKDSREYRTAIRILNFLRICFPEEDYQFLSKHAWVYSLYTMIRELSLSYSLNEKEELIRSFIENFHNKVYSEDKRRSNPTYQRFYDNVRGGWSEKIIVLRRNLLIREFLEKHKLEEFDEKRQISDEDKIAAFEKLKEKNCILCDKSFRDYKEPEYHHRIRHADGGKSDIENIVVLCDKCHDRVHGKESIELPSEKDVSEDGE